ncbi:hypothetical protein BH10BDE1_BH10BDE1_03410 [soil metagenome]
MDKLSGRTFAFLALLGLNGGCFSSSYSPFVKPPAYAVYEIEVLRSQKLTGERFRIAVIDGQLQDGLRGELWFDGKNLGPTTSRSSDGLGWDGLNLEQRRTIVVGKILKVSAANARLASLFSQNEIELESLNNQPAEYTLQLIKKCPARAENEEYTKIEWRSGGIMEIPIWKKRERLAIDRPACFIESDRTFNLGKVTTLDPEIAKQIEKANAESAEVDQRAEREKRRTNLMIKLGEEKQRSAHKLALANPWKRVDNAGFEDQLRNSICPEIVALGRIQKVARVTTDRVETERTNHADGSYSVRHESSLTLEFQDGHKDKISVALGKELIVEAAKSISVRPDGCVDIEARTDRVSSNEDIVRDISEVLKNHFNRSIQSDAYREALEQIPAD